VVFDYVLLARAEVRVDARAEAGVAVLFSEITQVRAQVMYFFYYDLM
jgi:hypothetical protein